MLFFFFVGRWSGGGSVWPASCLLANGGAQKFAYAKRLSVPPLGREHTVLSAFWCVEATGCCVWALHGPPALATAKVVFPVHAHCRKRAINSYAIRERASVVFAWSVAPRERHLRSGVWCVSAYIICIYVYACTVESMQGWGVGCRRRRRSEALGALTNCVQAAFVCFVVCVLCVCWRLPAIF